MRKHVLLSLSILLGASFETMAQTQFQLAAEWRSHGFTGYSGQPAFQGTLLSGAAKTALIQKTQAMSSNEVWDLLTTHVTTPKGASSVGYGTCYAYVHNGNPLFLVEGLYGSQGHRGYPKNPVTRDGTGYLTSCFNEHSVTNLCGISNHKDRAKATLIMALQNDVCGDIQGVQAKAPTQISILDSNKIFFVKPTESCAQGKPLCGTTSIGDKVGEFESFNQLPAKFCAASYGVIEKSAATFRAQGKSSSVDSRFITCDQLTQKKIKSDTLAQAKSVMSEMNNRYYGIDLPYAGYSESQLLTMNNAEIALFFVSMKEKADLLPQVIQNKIASIGEAELEAAREQYGKLLDDLKQNISEGQKKINLSQAIALIQQRQ